MCLKKRVGKSGSFTEGPLPWEDAGTWGLPTEARIRDEMEEKANEGLRGELRWAEWERKWKDWKQEGEQLECPKQISREIVDNDILFRLAASTMVALQPFTICWQFCRSLHQVGDISAVRNSNYLRLKISTKLAWKSKFWYMFSEMSNKFFEVSATLFSWITIFFLLIWVLKELHIILRANLWSIWFYVH